MKVSVSTTIEKALRDRLDLLADSKGFLRSYLLREAIERGYPGVILEFSNSPKRTRIKSNGTRKAK